MSNTREDRIQRVKSKNAAHAGNNNTGRRLTREEKLRRRRKRLIQVWIRRLAVLLVLILLVVAIIFGIRRLFFGGKTSSVYGLPDYITEDYLQVNRYSRPKVPLTAVNSIVIHYTANPGSTAAGNRNYFNNLAEQDGVENPTYASSNFIVGLEGEIIACVPLDEVAYASNNRNEDSLSIETCHPDETGKFSEVTYDSLVRLTAYLCNRFGLSSEDVIRHYDVSGKACPLYYVENEDAWNGFKADVQISIDAMSAEQNAASAAEGKSASSSGTESEAIGDSSEDTGSTSSSQSE